ncbi:DUF2325 domain-containing protein [Paucibacter sp. APW11]|uniref:DUF2325 domain-containing protein n=1 Tax=Roseateles aquae TaxID=3077235 RepID=A0ABU3P7R2_9BURK|nr:DUF2325 domain-containing protein [Paucibacter sp. APW11]MDT8998607.1 DUF2325 domain-containing protein [Paucibacter sp. APW11]
MCERRPDFARLLTAAARPATPDAPPLPTRQGSRRRRLWELPSQALCPVVGVCLPMPVLRKALGRLFGGLIEAGDYELHCGAINDSSRRSPVAELLQRELDQRFALALKEAARQKSTEALTRWWRAHVQGATVDGALWATLTHARCDEALQELVLRDIHMLQHQLGSAERVDQRRLQSLTQENLVLGRELAQAQSRCTQLAELQGRERDRLQASVVQLRAELLARDTLIASLRESLQQGGDAVLRRRDDAERLARQRTRIEALEAALAEAREALAQAARAPAADMRPGLRPAPADQAQGCTESAPLPRLAERAVLCVGGRAGVVPIYRQLIERTGGRFLHHDGGEEDAVTKLDASLAAADLVICQTGCISHDAYWRVKEHCKRHGKRCVFVDKPSASGLQRALDSLNPGAASEP